MRTAHLITARHGERVRSGGSAVRVRRHASRSVGLPQRPLGRQEDSRRNVVQRDTRNFRERRDGCKWRGLPHQGTLPRSALGTGGAPCKGCVLQLGRRGDAEGM
ncbi:unnamed protein product, partial [Laminaria digitata]